MSASEAVIHGLQILQTQESWAHRLAAPPHVHFSLGPRIEPLISHWKVDSKHWITREIPVTFLLSSLYFDLK